ncbi:hypothetical protein ACFZAB_30735 [Streptomyces albogriseolus]|uniref:hypothetical protein n=1 Tax=Streptomyces albogriseolus TaxID=1887 RepID=UPI00345F8589
MDEGVAAIVAGVAGMVGALGGAVAGGVAAIRGARIGAEKTAEATRAQVRDQAALDHRRWLQQQRVEAYSAFLEAWDAVLISITEAGGWREEPTPAEALGPVSDALRNLRSQLTRVTVVGPKRAQTLADDLVGAASQMRRMLELPESERRILADRDNLTGPDRERMRNLSLFPAKRIQFVRLAGEILSEAPVMLGSDQGDSEGDSR